mmetsp:Transcript_38986/g.93828  ORF Transcript_38986/g.93828 Transcript_38986/m.93828 type:complete len:367 (-) Transcript_38986:391-1491(-)
MIHHPPHIVILANELRLVLEGPKSPFLQLQLPIPLPLRLLANVRIIGGSIQPRLVQVSVILELPLSDVRYQSHVTSALHELRDLALILRAETGLHAIHDLAPRGGVPSEQAEVVVMEQPARDGLGVLPIDLARRVEIAGEQFREGIVVLPARPVCPPVQSRIEVREVEVGVEELLRIGRSGIAPRREGVAGDGIVVVHEFEVGGIHAVFLLGVGFEGLVLAGGERPVGFGNFRPGGRVLRIVDVGAVAPPPDDVVRRLAPDRSHRQPLLPDATRHALVLAVERSQSVVVRSSPPILRPPRRLGRGLLPTSAETFHDLLAPSVFVHPEQFSIALGNFRALLIGPLAGNGIADVRRRGGELVLAQEEV